jgi:hypothetical protein
MNTRVIAIVLLSFLVKGLVSGQLPKLTQKEVEQNWVLLFDGQSSKGWKRFNGDPFPSKGWKIQNGTISVDTTQGQTDDIVTENEYSNFELSLEVKLTEGANSGIKYLLLKNSNLGCEYQILDDLRHPDAKYNNRVQGSLYDLIAPVKDKKNKPIGEWNLVRIISNGKHVEHWLNGAKILEYERGSESFRKFVSESKFKNVKGFGEVEKSPILLQQHGGVVSFRNIKIRKL